MTTVSARLLVVVSGLPASGKSTVGRVLAEHLSLPLIDKDVILEALFDSLGCQDREQRSRLSRASDEVLYRLAESSGAAVVVNWWDHDTAPARLRATATDLVEVFCDCPAEIAERRFADRVRHPGHQDPQRTSEELEEKIRQTRDGFRGPLRLSNRLVVVDTSGELDASAVVDRVRDVL